MFGTITAPENARSRRTRAALLDASRSLLEQGGSPALTMAAAAGAAGVTRRAAYLHFESRSDLLVALFDHLARTEDLAGSLTPVWDAPDAAAALDAWADHVAGFHPRLLAVASAINHARHTDPGAEAHWQAVQHDQLAVSRRLVRRIDRDGALRAPWTVASATDMICALMSYDLLQELTIDRGWSVHRYRDHLAAVLHATFLHSPQS